MSESTGLDTGENVSDLLGPQFVAVGYNAAIGWIVGFLGTGSAAQRVVWIAVEMVDPLAVLSAKSENAFWVEFFSF